MLPQQRRLSGAMGNLSSTGGQGTAVCLCSALHACSEGHCSVWTIRPLQVICAGNTGGVGNAVVNVYINYEKKFAFVELRTVEEASNAMALDGIMFEGVAVRIRRPNDYNPAHAARLGPGNPNPNLNLAAVNLTPGGMDSEDRVRAPAWLLPLDTLLMAPGASLIQALQRPALCCSSLFPSTRW